MDEKSNEEESTMVGQMVVNAEPGVDRADRKASSRLSGIP
jgi:hypothetical protein